MSRLTKLARGKGLMRPKLEPQLELARTAYVDLLVRAVSNTIYEDGNLYPGLDARHERGIREEGKDWPAVAHTMIGVRRLSNLRHAVETVIREGVPGDLIETGVWRGRACILMAGILKAYDASERTVYVADSFAGLPAPDAERYAADAGDTHHTVDALAVGLEQVKENFRRYDLLSDQVRFVEGYFEDTLPTLRLGTLAVARLDGDMYGSTIVALEHLYPRLAPGGFLIVDDYGALSQCRQAVEDYRGRHGITDPIEQVDWTGVYWRKS